jgi:hypothetical protein
VLDGRTVHVRARLCQHRLALLALVAEHAHLDQFVLQKREIDFVHDRGSEAVLADGDDRLQVVRPGPQCAPIRSCKGVHPRSL